MIIYSSRIVNIITTVIIILINNNKNNTRDKKEIKITMQRNLLESDEAKGAKNISKITTLYSLLPLSAALRKSDLIFI